MGFKISLAFAVLFITICCEPDLFWGTGGFGFGCGSNSPAVQVPFSYVRLGPDTSPLLKQTYMPFQHFGGYSNADKAVRAFSHMHLVGAGVIDMGIFGILPKIGKRQETPKIPEDEIAVFIKDEEHAEPGYYRSQLKNNIKVELTSSQRCGAHRYTYTNPKNNPMNINIMTSYLLQKETERFTTTSVCGQNCLEGKIWLKGSFGGRFGGYNVHYHLEWASQDKNETVYLYQGSQIFRPSSIKNSVSHNKTGAIIKTTSNTVQIYIGISYVSISNARQNFEEEIKGKDFKQISSQAKSIWKQELSRFDILAINSQVQTKVDSAVYRTLLSPTIFEDWNGEYVSFKNDGSTSEKPSTMEHVYTDMSLWDVHRSQMPWLLFNDPYRFKDIAMSLVLINREGGYMPKWPFAQGPTGCMIGAHANTVLADWIMKEGKNDPNANLTEILGYMLRNANENTPHDGRSHIQEYLKLGHIPAELVGSSGCSETLEYSYNDFGISKIAQLLNQTSVAEQFLRRSKFYKNVWNPKTKFFEPRFSNESFKHISEMERINIFSNNYVEGDAWHYRFYAPHDAAGLIQLFGGQKPFVKELSKFFAKSFYWPTFWLPNPYYWAGNEHDLFSVWLFPFANRADLTQKYSRMIIDNFYTTKANGIPGNDDYGTMSAWLIFATLGFYPLPSTETFILGSPYIHYAKIQRRIDHNQYASFRIRTYNNNRDNHLVKEVKLNKEPTDNKFISHKNISEDNAYLQFWMY